MLIICIYFNFKIGFINITYRSFTYYFISYTNVAPLLIVPLSFKLQLSLKHIVSTRRIGFC